MPKDKKNQDEYPKISGKDKRWKQQDEFDSAGPLRQQEDEDKNTSIPEKVPASENERSQEKV